MSVIAADKEPTLQDARAKLSSMTHYSNDLRMKAELLIEILDKDINAGRKSTVDEKGITPTMKMPNLRFDIFEFINRTMDTLHELDIALTLLEKKLRNPETKKSDNKQNDYSTDTVTGVVVQGFVSQGGVVS